MGLTVTNVMAVSLDGKIGLHSHESDKARRDYGFTNLEDQEFVRTQLKNADAVITGANSLTASGAAWQVVNHRGRYADWIVFSNDGLDPALKFWQQNEIQRALVSKAPVTNDLNGVANWCYGNDQPARFVLNKLQELGYENILLFGGGSINRLFYDEGLVDFLKITVCPIIIGALDAACFVNPSLTSPTRLDLISSHVSGNHVFLNYKVHKVL
jgi:5-amino-6-(5-phosphoribosylamino)uracil reductase